MTAPDIDVVVFDIGGVLVASPLTEFVRLDAEYGLIPGTAMGLFRGGGLFEPCETGRMPFSTFCEHAVEQIRAEQGISVPAVRFAAMMAAIMGDQVEPTIHALVLQLKAAGLRIGLCSNIYSDLDGWIRSMFPPGTVDVHCLSYEVGLRKPDPAIYAALIERCACPAEKIVFVDDFVENVAGAGDAGLVAIRFTGTAALRESLAELRIVPA